MIPAFNMVILPQNPSTENGHVSGWSFILSVDINGWTCKVKMCILEHDTLAMEITRSRVVPIITRSRVIAMPENRNSVRPIGLCSPAAVLYLCALLVGSLDSIQMCCSYHAKCRMIL